MSDEKRDPAKPGVPTRTPTPVPAAELLERLRRMPLFRQLAPMECGIGWPMPLRIGPDSGATRVCLRLPLFGMRPLSGGGAELFPPFATVTLDRATARPMEYVDLRLTRPWPPPKGAEPVGTFPHEAVDGTVGDYRAARRELLALYDDLCDSLAAHTRFEHRDRFATLLRRLLEPGLEPYYRALGPDFYAHFLGRADGSGAP
ncbi:hypothetical protein [Streptomyces sp. KL118A]|uniref:hypothetical protein n=1 Tax=Streptomyces sp. KL118A TaxID=3045153 RepID=UPI00278C6BE3|nr:hypothetical protein [Streptomyces sp. KL118A]